MPARAVQDLASRASRGPARPDRDSGWQLAQRAWLDSGVDWEDLPAAADVYSPETDPYAADAYSVTRYPAAPFDPDSWEAGRDEADEYEADSYQAHSYEDDDHEATSYGERGSYDETDSFDETGSYEESGQYDADPPHADPPHADPPHADPPHAAEHPADLNDSDRNDAGPLLQAAPRLKAAPRFASFTPAPSPPARSTPAPSKPAPSTTVPAFAATRAFSVGPLGAPVAPAAPAGTEPDELFRAWQGSVREASAQPGPWAGRRAASRAAHRGRGRGGQAAKVVVPAAVIVTVGAGALLMLTGRANEMLAERATVSPAVSATPEFSASLSPVSRPLGGYPGQQGTVGVAAMWSAAGLTVAVGSADSHPAVWRRAPDGNWSLVSAAALGGLPGHLTSVSEGPLGWIAVGSVAANGTVEPMAYQSADGVTWIPLPGLTALAGSDAQFVGVAAGPGGYVVVGRQGSGSHTSAAMWWSGDLKDWVNGGSGGGAGSYAAAVVSVGNGFAAVGADMNCHAIWMSPDGKQWTAHDLAKPDGAQTATLRSVAASSAGHIVAAGFATKNGSDIPIVVTSADGGAQLTQVVLSTPAGPATVTAVTAASSGFVAVGLAGPATAQRTVSWTSADGLRWSAASPLSAAGSSEVTALTDTGAATAPAGSGSAGTGSAGTGSAGTGSAGTGRAGTGSAGAGSAGAGSSVTGTAQHGASPTLLTVPAR